MSPRMRYFFIHLAVSVLIGLVLGWVMFGYWYPKALYHSVGALPLMVAVLGAVVLIWPVMSLVVYKTGKKTLKMDLAVIALLQMMTIIFGMYGLSKGRPAFLVYTGAVLYVVKNSDLPEQYQSLASPLQYATLNHKGALADRLTTREPANVYDPNDYVAFSPQDIKPLSLHYLTSFNDEPKVDEVLSKYSADGWIGVAGPAENRVMLMNGNEMVALVDLRPWG